jgi:cytochrome P450
MGHSAAFQRDRMGTLALLARSRAPLQRLRTLPVVHAVVAHDPEVVQEVLVDKSKSFVKSDMLRFALHDLAGEGLFTSNGDLWRRQRKRMAPLFTPKALATYGEDMVACAERTVASWGERSDIVLADETTRLTMGIAGKTLFDADTFSEADEIGKALATALEWTGRVIGSPAALAHVVAHRAFDEIGRRTSGITSEYAKIAARALTGPKLLVGRRHREFRAAIRYLDARVQRMIDERRAAIARGSAELPQDLLTRLLDASASEGDDASTEKMSDRQVRDEVLTLFVAGHETTATGLAWTLYAAVRDRAIYARLRDEVDALEKRPTLDDLPRLGYCLRAFKEALRVYPPVYMFGRDSTCDVTVAGFDLPRRTNVMICPWAMHHAAHVWPSPERFDPDRFLPEQEASRHRYAYLPFGAGPRICLGNHFAYMEAQLTLAVLLSRYDFELLGDDVPEPGATLRPKHGVRMRVTRRALRSPS